MNWITVAAVVAAMVAFVLARMYVARRFATTGAPWTIWFLFGIPVLAGLFIGWIGLTLIDRSPVLTIFLLVLGLAWIYFSVRRIQSTSRSVAKASTPSGRTDALFPPLADYMLGLVALMMLMAVALVVLALIGLLR